MTDAIRPPMLAALLLSPFASEPDFSQIEGDLIEEFNGRVIESGPASARRWYWRQTLRNLLALLKRPRTIQVFVIAALSLLVYTSIVQSFFHWLQVRLYSAPRVSGLRLILMAIFEITIALALGVLMSRALKGRERMLQVCFSILFLLFLAGNYSRYLIDQPDVRTLLQSITAALVLIAFWLGSVWMRRRRLMHLAA